MTKRRFGKRLSFGVAMMLAGPFRWLRLRVGAAGRAAPKAAKLIKAGDVLSGELNAMKVRGGKKGKRVADLPGHQRAAPAADRRTGYAVWKPGRRPFRSSPTATPRRRN